jgi:PPOX class probable F420-dependent enzyme
MAMPILDPSDPKHARALERFGTEIIVWLTTVTPDGQPNTTPVWFWWDGEAFHLYSQPGRPKLRNIAANPRVSLHLQSDETGDEDVVIVEGLAAVDPEAPPADRVPAYIDRYRTFVEAYGWTPASFAADYAVGIRIEPRKARVP